MARKGFKVGDVVEHVNPNHVKKVKTGKVLKVLDPEFFPSRNILVAWDQDPNLSYYYRPNELKKAKKVKE